MFWWLLLPLALVPIIYHYLIKLHKHWAQKGVPHTTPNFIFGDNLNFMRRKEAFAETTQRVYNQFPNARYSGMYQFLIPTLVLRDVDLIKQITVKDFDNFVDHRSFIPAEADILWSKNLFALTGQKWRDMRSTLSPAFTSSKMRQMFVLISNSAQQFTEYFRNQKGEDVITIEMKDTFTRFTNDVIATTAFGLSCDSLTSRKNEFYMMGKELTNFSGLLQKLKFTALTVIPRISALLKITMFSKTETNFFINLMKTTIDTREKQGITRPDMLNLLLEARKHGLKYEEQTENDTGFATVQESDIGKMQKTLKQQEITDLDITAQALIFFFAGFDTVSSLMCFLSYELALNPDIQERLRNEIDETCRTCGADKLTYEALSKMKYLDMVVSEALRKWPPGVAVDRVCTKPYTIQPQTPEEHAVSLAVGDVIWLPIFGLHRDPKYFPNPERFDPERFNDENKHKIVPYSYLPFGSGPRNCIGSRFALLEAKTLFYYLLASFEIVPVAKTDIPFKISKSQFNLSAENGFWLGLKRRN